MKLADLQAQVFAAVSGRDPVSAVVEQCVKNSGAAGAEERVEAYRANIKGAHLNALDQAFPVVREVLGPRYWQHLLIEETQAFVTDAADLHAYGEFVPGLLQAAQLKRPELGEMPYLTDLAALEWRVHQARFTADGPDFNWQAFTALPAPSQSRAIFQLSPALSLLQSRYPVDDIWHAHQASGKRPAECELPAVCCIHRISRFDVTVTRLGTGNADILEAVANGASLAEISENLSDHDPELMIAEFYQWIQRGWIVGFQCPLRPA